MENTRQSQRASMESRWAALWNELGAKGDPNAVFESLLEEYSKGRAYHNLTHVEFCLDQLDRVRMEVKDPNAVAFALWFHDAVYDTRSQDSEVRSAKWAMDVAIGAGLGKEFAEKVRDLILSTRHATDLERDAEFLKDIDLAILGQPAEAFDIYDRSVAQEYSWVPREVYNTKRREILERFISKDRKSIFSTEFFRGEYEARARDNVERAIEQLSPKDESPKIAVYAGSFDPPTLGHEWVIKSGRRLFSKLIVAVAVNPAKKGTFTVQERVAMLKAMTSGFPNVEVASFENVYTAHFAKAVGAGYLLRGVRNGTDFEYEKTIAEINSDLEPEIITLSLTPPPEVAKISSSLVKSLIGPEGWRDAIRRYLPPEAYSEMLRHNPT
ncbi:MAG: pantetheine-phosphate adenylyltransferase [Candidatus Micrarchaeales archaeon]|nr:pantetheine-phosphate adenylyltransferase [Candidatus Micrarchaeales archaeon]